MTLTSGMLSAIARTVRDAGGDMADAVDLAESWERLVADTSGRVDRMRAQAKLVRCCCARGGEPMRDGRCGRCWGLIGGEL